MATDDRGRIAGIFNAATQVVDQTGRPTPVFFRLIERLYQRTGGSDDALFDLLNGNSDGSPLARFAASLNDDGQTVLDFVRDSGNLAPLDAGDGLTIDTSANELNADVLSVFGSTGNVRITTQSEITTVDGANDFLIISDGSDGGQERRVQAGRIGNAEVRLTKLRLDVRDNGVDDIYTLSYELGVQVTTGNTVQFVLFKDGTFDGVFTSTNPQSGIFRVNVTSGGNTAINNHTVIANLLDTTGASVVSISAYAASIVENSILLEDGSDIELESGFVLLGED